MINSVATPATLHICLLVKNATCSTVYVGETSLSLRDRITDHVSCIRLKKPTPIGVQFNQAGQSLKHFTVLAIEQFDDNSAIRHMKESTWQRLLQTAHPLGISRRRV